MDIASLPKVEMSADALIPGEMYLWKRPYGEIVPVWLNDEKDGVWEFEDEWFFDVNRAQSLTLAGELYGPVRLKEAPCQNSQEKK